MDIWNCVNCGKEIKKGEKYSESPGIGKMCKECTKMTEDIYKSLGGGDDMFIDMTGNKK